MNLHNPMRGRINGVWRVYCHQCGWAGWFFDLRDAERYAARHRAVTAREEGR